MLFEGSKMEVKNFILREFYFYDIFILDSD